MNKSASQNQRSPHPYFLPRKGRGAVRGGDFNYGTRSKRLASITYGSPMDERGEGAR